jgi:general secretion pathway protein D
VPWLSDIPLLGEVFKSRSQDQANDTLFVFVRPTILRDKSFGDLVSLSRADLKAARLARQDEPTNPLKMFPAEDGGQEPRERADTRSDE